MRRSRPFSHHAAITATLAAVLVGTLGFVPAAEARMSCSFAEGSPGVLSILAQDPRTFGDVFRSGDEIVVSKRRADPLRCAGGVPTVFGIDTIRVRLARSSDVALRLAGGPFAPGATAETEGASEIEVEFFVRSSYGRVVGTPAADKLHWVPDGARAGLNLNPLSAHDRDADVTVNGRGSFLVVQGAGGNDTIVPDDVDDVAAFVYSEGGRGNDLLAAPPLAGGILYGEAGNDDLRGGRSFERLDGGPGDDRITGRDGDDEIDAGAGNDLVSGGLGGDHIVVDDNSRDIVRCGAGRDRVRADRRDRLHDCEKVSRT